MDQITHSAMLWIVMGAAVLTLFIWLAMLSVSEGREREADIDRMLGQASTAGSIVDQGARSSDTVAASADRFRALGDPEYGLFLDDAPDLRGAISAA